MKRYLSVLLSSILSGFFICFGATVYIMCASHDDYLIKIIGSFLFGIGLFTIISFKLWLYTGKIGYVFENKKEYLINLLICLLGNILGAFTLAILIKTSGIITPSILQFAKDLVLNKQNEKWYEMLIRSFMCGVMIYLAVEGNKKCENVIGKILFAFVPISLFILCGFEHIIANVAYYTIAGIFDLNSLLLFLMMLIGNSLGSIFIYFGFKGIEYLNK